MPKTKSEEAKIDFSGNPFFSGKFPSLINKGKKICETKNGWKWGGGEWGQSNVRKV